MNDSTGHGGKRNGSGRKTKYRSTSDGQSVRVPKEYVNAVYDFLDWLDKTTYPSTSDDQIRQYLESKNKQS